MNPSMAIKMAIEEFKNSRNISLDTIVQRAEELVGSDSKKYQKRAFQQYLKKKVTDFFSSSKISISDQEELFPDLQNEAFFSVKGQDGKSTWISFSNLEKKELLQIKRRKNARLSKATRETEKFNQISEGLLQLMEDKNETVGDALKKQAKKT